MLKDEKDLAKSSAMRGADKEVIRIWSEAESRRIVHSNFKFCLPQPGIMLSFLFKVKKNLSGPAVLGKQGRMNQSAVLSQAPDAGLVRSDAELHHGGGVRLPGGEQFPLVQVRHCKLAWVDVGSGHC